MESETLQLKFKSKEYVHVSKNMTLNLDNSIEIPEIHFKLQELSRMKLLRWTKIQCKIFCFRVRSRKLGDVGSISSNLACSRPPRCFIISNRRKVLTISSDITELGSISSIHFKVGKNHYKLKYAPEN